MASDAAHKDPKVEAAAIALFGFGKVVAFQSKMTDEEKAAATAEANIVRWQDASRADREHYRGMAEVAARAFGFAQL